MVSRYYGYKLSSSSKISATARISSAINRSCITYTKMLLAKLGEPFRYIQMIEEAKCVFGQQSYVAQVHLSNVTMGKQTANDNDKGPLN